MGEGAKVKAKKARGAVAASAAGSSRELAKAKLLASGIDAAAADRLGLKELGRAEIEAVFRMAGSDVPRQFTWTHGLHVPYHDERGERTGYFRVRGLGVGAHGTTPVDSREKEFKYAGPEGTTPTAYLPRTEDWQGILADAARRVVITEGELKAASCCLHGVPATAVGGVWMFTSKKTGTWFDPTLERLAAGGREVVIAFDSDQRDKPEVLQAQSELAKRLTDAGAKVRIASIRDAAVERGLDPVPKGLDDFLMAVPEDERHAALGALVESAESCDLSLALHEMNLRYAVIDELNGVLDLETARVKTWRDFEMLNKNVKFTEHGVDARGEATMKRAEAAKAWLSWPHRVKLDHLDYAPGEPRFVDGGRAYNLWRGWGVEPKKGDLKPWDFLVGEQLFRGDAEARRWFEAWLAWPLQNPGGKLYTAVVMWSHLQGVGKNMAAEAVARIYGEKTRVAPWGNCATIRDDDLESRFTDSWARGTQLVIADEISGLDNRKVASKLKTFVTGPTIPVEAKNQQRYELRNTMQFWFLSQHSDALFLERWDRRYWVHEVTAPPLTREKAEWVREWKDGHGPAALFHHLLTLDISGFGPRAPAPMTASKREMIRDSMGELDLWCTTLSEDPDTALRGGGGIQGLPGSASELFTASDLTAYFNAAKSKGAKDVSEPMMGRALKRARLRKLSYADGGGWKDAQVRVDGANKTFWVVRNHDEWSLAGLAEPQRLAKLAKAREHYQMHCVRAPKSKMG